MNLKQTLSELKKHGTAQNRKIYGRHGVQDDMFGVSYANQGVLKKKIGTDHELALELFDSEMHDARILATMVADPEKLSVATANKWVGALNDTVTTGAVAGLIAKSKHAQSKIKQWMKAKDEWKCAAGWTTLAAYATHDESESDAYFKPFVAQIEKNIHEEKNQVRHCMNQALIAIGSRSDALAKSATAAAKKIGKVEVDHGETSCKTPDATAYIAKARARMAAKKTKAKAKK